MLHPWGHRELDTTEQLNNNHNRKMTRKTRQLVTARLFLDVSGGLILTGGIF